MPANVVLKKGALDSTVKRKSARATNSTETADGIARQVTRAEFMELSTVVAQLRKDSLRHQAVGEG